MWSPPTSSLVDIPWGDEWELCINCGNSFDGSKAKHIFDPVQKHYTYKCPRCGKPYNTKIEKRKKKNESKRVEG